MTFKAELDTYRFIMDIETYVLESTSIPFTNKVIIDKDVMYDFLDRLRTKIPQEMRECKNFIDKKQKEEINITKTEPVFEQINTQIEEAKILSKIQTNTEKQNAEKIKEAEERAERMTKDAEERAERIKKDAEERAQKTTQDAEERAWRTIKEAEERAQKTIKDAYGHAQEIVGNIEFQLEQQIAEIKDGRSQIANITRKLKNY